MKVAGDWTKKLKTKFFQCVNTKGVCMQRVGDNCIINIDENIAYKNEENDENVLPLIRVDGPYGSPNEVLYIHTISKTFYFWFLVFTCLKVKIIELL